MKLFAELYQNLDETTKTNVKVDALAEFFSKASKSDSAWAIRFLAGRRVKRLVRHGDLRSWAAELAELPTWLFEESYSAVGDLAETISLVIPEGKGIDKDSTLTDWVNERLLPLRKLDDEEKKKLILDSWSHLNRQQIFVWNKVMTGGFRVGVSQKLVLKGLSKFSGIEEPVLAHRLMGDWEPTEEFFEQLISEDTEGDDISKPYPFYLAYQLEDNLKDLGHPDEWHIEWKWDGIRSQIIKRNGEVFIWSRGEDLINNTFPEIVESAQNLPDGTVLDGELVAWKDDAPLNFGDLQKRLGRKNVSANMIKKYPCIITVFDILEHEGIDLRTKPLDERKQILNNLMNDSHSKFRISENVSAKSWEEYFELRKDSREKGVEGLMLKRKNSEYKVGRKRGDWWKWKVDPLTIDAVLLYAQRGHGRRSSLYSDYTFAVWNGDELVPFAKAYSGLTDSEIRKVDRYVRKNTKEKFGPVRSVTPNLVFEIAFEGIRESKRHKSGVAVRFPRMSRWRRDKNVEEADTIETLNKMLELYA